VSEHSQRQVVIRALKPLDGRSVENTVGPGTPDVNYADGWIELKVLDHWPRNAITPVRITHYTQQQRIWAMKRAAAQGQVFMLILVEEVQEWVLLRGADAAVLVSSEGKTIKEGTQQTIRERALAVWQGSAELQENLVPCLSKRPN
jgi:hypothetical protein